MPGSNGGSSVLSEVQIVKAVSCPACKELVYVKSNRCPFCNCPLYLRQEPTETIDKLTKKEY